MNKRVNIEEQTRKINEFISKNKGKVVTGSSDLVAELHKIGFNKTVAYKIISGFEKEKMGTITLYSIPSEPIYIKRLEGYYKSVNKEALERKRTKKSEIEIQQSEEAALAFLSSKGYQIRKCVGFDLERFAKENPVLYKKYLKYEIV